MQKCRVRHFPKTELLTGRANSSESRRSAIGSLRSRWCCSVRIVFRQLHDRRTESRGRAYSARHVVKRHSQCVHRVIGPANLSKKLIVAKEADFRHSFFKAPKEIEHRQNGREKCFRLFFGEFVAVHGRRLREGDGWD
jgi:hypothetical protein